MTRHPPKSTLFPNTTLFRSFVGGAERELRGVTDLLRRIQGAPFGGPGRFPLAESQEFRARQVASSPHGGRHPPRDRKSTRLNSSHSQISYAVFCLKKNKSHPRLPPSRRVRPSSLSSLAPPWSRTRPDPPSM